MSPPCSASTLVDARERMAALVERSIAGRQPSGRFYLLDIVRRFARERLDASERDALQAGYAAAIRQTAVRLGDELVHAKGASPIVAFNQLAADFRAVIASSLAAGDIETAITIITSVRDLALNALSPDLMRLGAEVAAAADGIDHPLTADAYAVAAQGAWKRGDLGEMRQLLERAVAATERLQIGDRYDVLGTLATEDLAHGRMREAVENYRARQRNQGGDRQPVAACRGWRLDGDLHVVRPHAAGDRDRRSTARRDRARRRFGGSRVVLLRSGGVPGARRSGRCSSICSSRPSMPPAPVAPRSSKPSPAHRWRRSTFATATSRTRSRPTAGCCRCGCGQVCGGRSGRRCGG